MGYAIIKDINSSKGYALNRLIQNLIPVKESLRQALVKNNISFSYNTTDVEDGIYRLSSVNLGNGNQPYIYKLKQESDYTEINPISGVVTIKEGFTGSSVTVVLEAVYDGVYYIEPSSGKVSKELPINVSAPSHVPALDVYSDFSLNTFSYANSNTITAATLSTGTPTISYSYKLNGETKTGSCTYTFTDEYDGASVNSNGVVTFDSKNTTDSDKQCPVNITFLYPNGTLAGTGRAIVKQSARVLSNITFLSYNSASSISVNSGSSILASAFVIKATYNSGEITVGPNSTDIKISSTSSGTYGNSISNVTANGTVYIKYKDYTSNIISKAYTVASLTNNLTVTNNTGGYALTGTTLTTDDFVVKDSSNNTVSSFTISPTSVATEGTQTVTITSGSDTGTIEMLFVDLSSFSAEQALLGADVTNGLVDNTTLFYGPSNSSSTPYQESGKKSHLGKEFLQNAKEGDLYLIYLFCEGSNLPTDNSRIMASTLPVLDFENLSDPYTGTGSSSSAGGAPTGYVAPYKTIEPNKLCLYTVGDTNNIITENDNIILTVFAHFNASSSLTKIRYRKVGLTPTYRYSISSLKTGSSQSSSKAYGEENDGVIEDNILTCEPYVNVLDSTNSTTTLMTLSLYNMLSNKTPYTLTYETLYFDHYNNAAGDGTIKIDPVDGTLTYDLVKIRNISGNFVFKEIGVKLILTNNVDGTTITSLSSGLSAVRPVRKQGLFGLEQAYDMESSALTWTGTAHVGEGTGSANNYAAIGTSSPYNSTTHTLTLLNKEPKNVVLNENTSYLIKFSSWDAPVAIVEESNYEHMNTTYLIDGSTNIYQYVESIGYIKYTTGTSKVVLLSSNYATTAYLGTLKNS